MIVLDVGCYGELRDSSVRRRAVVSARSAGHLIAPSQANAFEIIRYQNRQRREQLLGVLQELKGNSPLLPWPEDLLARIATAAATGQSRVPIAPADIDEIVADPSLLTSEHFNEVNTFLEGEEAKARDAAKEGRKAARAVMKERGNRKPFESAHDFLDQWSDPANLRTYLDHDLTSIGLAPTDGLCDALLTNPEWRLHYDITGVAMYRQMMEPKEPKWVGRVDLAQVVYLGKADILVSRDKAMLEAARDAVTGRYENKRIMSWDEFLAQAG